MEEKHIEEFCPALVNPQGIKSANPYQSSRHSNIPGLQNQLLDVIEFLPDATFVIDKEGRVIAWNPAMEKMTGIAAADILGQGDFAYAIPFYGRRRPISIDYAMGSTSRIDFKYSTWQREGDTFLAETFCPLLFDGRGAFLWAKASPSLHDSEGGVIGAVESIRDITAHKRAEYELRKSEENYRLIFQNSPVGIFHFDVEGAIIDCNDKILEIWGSAKERLIGFNLLSSLKNKKMKAAIKNCISGGYTYYEGIYVSVTGGKISNLKADYGPIFDSDGKVVGGIGMIEDVSERRSAEEALEESERRYKSMAAELLAAQEKERNEIARELSESVGSSLAAIKLGVENTLAMERMGNLQQDNLRSIAEMVQHAMDESRRIISELRPSMLDDLGIISTLRWLTRQFKTFYSNMKIDMSIEVDEEEIPEDLKIIFFRIIQEALHCIVKHSQPDSIVIGLTRSGDTLRLKIEDNGSGFDPAVLSGKGRCLFSMKECTELFGGQMTTSSKDGVGTCIEACWSLGVEP